ncbi:MULTISPECIES: MlaA family lipoprotein [unclassified Pseudomonas]|uniref:MlaA family lipoprotein n=1 Tax=unclassified Pseudomonas TaxID=196821 RepID=UPI00236106A3|nr:MULTISPECIES: MlaA family lipoprotein [unclassified Pseudomonas]
MKTIQSLVLAAIVLGTSACASNAVKQAPAAGLSDAPSTSGTLVASVVEAPPAAVAITPSPGHTHTTTGAAAGGTSPPVVTSAQTAETSANAPEAMTQAEQEAEALYATPAVRDPWEGFNRKMHSFNNVLDRFVLRPVAVGYDKITPDPVQSGVSRFFSNLRLPATAINQALQGRPGDAGHPRQPVSGGRARRQYG